MNKIGAGGPRGAATRGGNLDKQGEFAGEDLDREADESAVVIRMAIKDKSGEAGRAMDTNQGKPQQGQDHRLFPGQEPRPEDNDWKGEEGEGRGAKGRMTGRMNGKRGGGQGGGLDKRGAWAGEGLDREGDESAVQIRMAIKDKDVEAGRAMDSRQGGRRPVAGRPMAGRPMAGRPRP